MSVEKSAVLEITKNALSLVNPMLGGLVEMTLESIKKAEVVGGSGNIAELRSEAERQELQMFMAERQAKVAQEVALAHRIETADEVEMEEYYDLSGSGDLGIKADEKSISAGLGAKGQKVSKRIFRFKGHGQSK